MLRRESPISNIGSFSCNSAGLNPHKCYRPMYSCVCLPKNYVATAHYYTVPSPHIIIQLLEITRLLVAFLS
jgi:hypothetical protein